MTTLSPKEATEFHHTVCDAVNKMKEDGYNIAGPNGSDPTSVINPSKDEDLYLGKDEDYDGYKKIMKTARRVNRKRDEDEKKMGLLTVSQDSPDGILRTAMMALRAGIITKDVTCLAEAQAMIELVEYRLRRCVVSIKH